MGTSSSYGGSSKKSWKSARQVAAQLFQGDSAGTSPPSSTRVPDVARMLRHIGAGLYSDDSELRKDPASVPLAQIIAAGLVVAGLPRIARPSPVTKERPVLIGARRLGAAVGGGMALRTGNNANLAQLQLDVNELKSLSPVRQTELILDQVFGISADENEKAFRDAAAVVLLQLLLAPEGEADYTAVFAEAAAELIFRRALVEIQQQIVQGALTPDEARERERQIRDYIRDLVRGVMKRFEGTPTPQECADAMAVVTKAAIDALRTVEEERLLEHHGVTSARQSASDNEVEPDQVAAES